MKYKFNGLEVDSQFGHPALGIPSGTLVPVRPGDVLEWSVNKITFKSEGLFDFVGSTLVRARGTMAPPVKFSDDHFVVVKRHGNS